jgi:hypothetical protein
MKPFNHGFHFIVATLTLGVWIPFWLLFWALHAVQYSAYPNTYYVDSWIEPVTIVEHHQNVIVEKSHCSCTCKKDRETNDRYYESEERA